MHVLNSFIHLFVSPLPPPCLFSPTSFAPTKSACPQPHSPPSTSKLLLSSQTCCTTASEALICVETLYCSLIGLGVYQSLSNLISFSQSRPACLRATSRLSFFIRTDEANKNFYPWIPILIIAVSDFSYFCLRQASFSLHYLLAAAPSQTGRHHQNGSNSQKLWSSIEWLLTWAGAV